MDFEVRDALDAYTRRVRDFFGDDGLVGVYLYGSVVCGDYRPGISDLDLVVLHRWDLDGRRRGLAELHERMGRRVAAGRLDVSFVPRRLVGTYGEGGLPCYRDGRFRPDGDGDLNMVTWRSLREHGAALCGAPPADVVPPVSPEDLAENMRRNLAFLRRRMPAYVATGAEETVFGVLSLCRVLHTLRTGALIGKVAAARWALEYTEPQWRPLIEHSMSRYEENDLSPLDAAFRARALAFARRASEPTRS